MPASTRTTWIDAGRGMAIVLVVLLHTQEWLETAGYRSGAWDVVDQLGTGVRMPVFFMISGLLARKWLDRPVRELAATRLLLLFWVYLVWQVVGSGTALAAAHITGDHLHPLRMLESLVASVFRPRFELWFLWLLVWFLLAARLTRRVPLAVQFAVAGVASALFLSHDIHIANLGWDGAGQMYLFFLIGIRGGPAVLRLAGRMTPPVAVAAIAVWALLAVSSFHLGWDGVPGVGLAVRLAGAVAGVALAVALSDLGPLRELGSRTLPVYVAHVPLIVLMAWAVFVVRPPVPAWLLVPVLAALAIAGGLLIHRVLMPTPGRVLYRPPAWLYALLAPPHGRHRDAPAQTLSAARTAAVAPSPPAPELVTRPDSST